MAALKYKVISSKKQYRNYANKLEELVFSGLKDRNTKDEIALLTLLIGKWDADHNTFEDLDPVQLLQSLMNDHNMKAIDIARVLGISGGYVSAILQYKKGLSQEVICKLASHFKLSQQAFNNR